MADRVVIAGSSGLIGGALTDSLRTDRVEVIRLVRRPAERQDEATWDPASRHLDPGILAGADAIVNLAGASIGRLPWTPAYRRRLWASRIDATRTLATALRSLGTEAPALISASAVGWYGNRPGETLTEDSTPGDTFLARLTVAWEREALAAGSASRVALLRTAPILHPRGVLRPMITLTKLGLSGPLGRGTQIWPWISLTDEVRAIRHIIDRGISGAVNLSGPTPASATVIGRELARHLRRPYAVPAPAWALRALLGRDAADSLLLTDANVQPEVLHCTGFEFTHAHPRDAITSSLL